MWNNASMPSAPPVPSLLRRIGISFLLGFGLFVLGAILQRFLEQKGVAGLHAYADDLLLGLVAGLLVFVYEQRRYYALMQRLSVIAAMNHHVRNALQAISYAPYTEQGKQIKLIQESVGRIQWALTEVLPGESEDAEDFYPAGEHKG